MRRGKEESKYEIVRQWTCHPLTRQEAGLVAKPPPERPYETTNFTKLEKKVGMRNISPCSSQSLVS